MLVRSSPQAAQIETSEPIDRKVYGILTSFSKESELNNIWFTVDTKGLKGAYHGPDFYDIIQTALNTAETTCVSSVPPLQRYINFKTKRVSDEIFIKIEYSRDGAHIPEENAGFKILKLMIKDAGGYLKLKNVDSLGNINIVMPGLYTA